MEENIKQIRKGNTTKTNKNKTNSYGLNIALSNGPSYWKKKSQELLHLYAQDLDHVDCYATVGYWLWINKLGKGKEIKTKSRIFYVHIVWRLTCVITPGSTSNHMNRMIQGKSNHNRNINDECCLLRILLILACFDTVYCHWACDFMIFKLFWCNL